MESSWSVSSAIRSMMPACTHMAQACEGEPTRAPSTRGRGMSKLTDAVSTMRKDVQAPSSCCRRHTGTKLPQPAGRTRAIARLLRGPLPQIGTIETEPGLANLQNWERSEAHRPHRRDKDMQTDTVYRRHGASLRAHRSGWLALEGPPPWYPQPALPNPTRNP
jgi:hypothetical protein